MIAGCLPGGDFLRDWLLLGAERVMDALIHLLAMAHQAGLDPLFAVLRPFWPEVLGFALLLVAALLPRSRLRLAALGAVLTLGPHVFVMAQDATAGMRLDMIDVGQGQALVVTAPGGRRVLIDGGGTASRTFDIGRAVVGPYLAYGRPPRVERVVMTHADNDHMGGLAWIVERFDVDVFYGNGDAPDGLAGSRIRKALGERGIPSRHLQNGHVLPLGGGGALHVVHPGRDRADLNSNDGSVVMRLDWEGESLALLTGDVEAKGIEQMLERGADLHATVLVMPHHGSKGSAPKTIVSHVRPEHALISCGRFNRFGFPHAEVLGALREHGVPAMRTDLSGAVELSWEKSQR